MPNPEGMNYCKVVGRFRAFVPDGSDTGSEPDFAPMTGTITFTPNITHARNTTIGAEEIYFPEPVTVVLDADGDLTLNGEKGVYLLCPSAAMNPAAWNWTASFRLKLPSGKLVRSFGPFPFDVTAGGEVDLAVALPVPAANGEWAIIGPAGPAGPPGAAGAQGPAGPMGPAGPQGEASTVPGPQGATGPAGPQGVAGATGPQGPVGPQGAVGPAGMTWRGAWDPAVDYELHDTVYHNGSSWFAAVDPPITAEPYDGSGQWQPLAIQGPAGPQGTPGAPGAQGPMGEQGPAGETGPIGPAGPTGPAGPAGETGPAGPAGADGAPGVDGADGADGATGPAGPAGPQGETGPAGPQGPAGPVVPLNDLTDVDTTGVADNMVLTYDSGTSTWKAEAATGLPSGGTAYQTLVKNSSTNGDASWVRQGRWRGTWDSVQKVSGYDFTNDIPSFFTVSGTPTTSRVANFGANTTAPQATVLSMTGSTGAGVSFTVPAGISQMRYVWARPSGSTMSYGEVLVGGTQRDSTNTAWSAYPWTSRSLSVSPGNAVTFQHVYSGNAGIFYLAEVSFWASLDPYMMGDGVAYNGVVYVSTANNNSTTPGASGASWTPLTNSISDTTGPYTTPSFKVWSNVPANSSTANDPMVWFDTSGVPSNQRVPLRVTQGNVSGEMFQAGIWFQNYFYRRFAINNNGSISRLNEIDFTIATGTGNPQDLIPNGHYGLAAASDRHMLYMRRNTNNAAWPAWNIQPVGYSGHVQTVTANHTIDCREAAIVGNGSNITVTLPDPSSSGLPGRKFEIKNIHTTNLTVVSAGTSKTIDGAANRQLARWQAITVMTDGAQWLIVSSHTEGSVDGGSPAATYTTDQTLDGGAP